MVYRTHFGLLSAFLFLLISPSYSSNLQVGFASFSIESPGLSPSGSALFSLTNPEGILVSEAGVGAVKAVGKGRVFVQQKGSLGTGVAFANPFNRKVTFRLVLRGRSGFERDRLDKVELAPHEHRARFVNELFKGVPDGFIGSLTFEGLTPSDKVAAVTLRQSANKYGEPLFATLPVIPVDDSQSSSLENQAFMIFPHIGAGPELSTQLVLISRSESRTVGKIRLIGSDGKALRLRLAGQAGSEFPYEIPPHGVFFAELKSLPGADVAVGYARVEATEGNLPGGTAIFRYFDESGLVSEAGVGSMPLLKKARIFVDTAETATGFAVANPGIKNTTITFRLLDCNGYLIQSTKKTLKSGNHMARFASELFTLPKRFTGLLEIESLNDFVPITLKLSQNARNESILTTLPVANLSQPVSISLMVFPQLATGSNAIGEFSTSLIFIGPLQDESSTGTMRFWKGTGIPFDLEAISSKFKFGVDGRASAQIFFTEQPREVVLDKGVSTDSKIGIEGGTLAIEDSQENLIILDIPPYALEKTETIRMTVLKSPPTISGSVNVFPGLILEPHGLVMKEPARLRIILSEPIRSPDRTLINWIGYKGTPMSSSNQFAAGQIVACDLHHFSEYTVEEYNISTLLMAAEVLIAMNNPKHRQELKLYYEEYFGFNLDNPTIELLVRLSDIDTLLIYYGQKKALGDDYLDPAVLGLMEELMLDVLKSTPKDPCGAHHSLVFQLTQLAKKYPELNLESNLRTQLQNIELDCLNADLTGTWKEEPVGQLEYCIMRLSMDESIEFQEADVTESYTIEVNQNGSSLLMSFPQFPGSPSISGGLKSTGLTQYPYYFTAGRSGSDSLDCITFYESGGYQFEFGSPICSTLDGCVPLSCEESQLWRGKVSFDGNSIQGKESWTFGASARVIPSGSSPPFISSISCIGSGQFKAKRK